MPEVLPRRTVEKTRSPGYPHPSLLEPLSTRLGEAAPGFRPAISAFGEDVNISFPLPNRPFVTDPGWLNGAYQHGCGMGKVSPRSGVESVERAILVIAGQSTRARLNFPL